MDTQIESASIFDELEEERRFTYATTGQRFANYLIDTVVMCNVYAGILGIIIAAVIAMNGEDPEQTPFFDDSISSKLFSYSLGFVCMLVSYTLIEGASKGRTLGKLITKTKAIREDGSEITFRDAFRRSLWRIVPFEPFSAFMAYPWHDKNTNTIVVKKF